jgi:putative DNA primase/helicase
LAKLSDLEYERVRRDEANKLEIDRVSVLDAARKAARRKNGSGDDGKSGTKLSLPDPTPWPERIDGDDLLDQLAGVFRRYLALPPYADVVLPLWAVHSFTFDTGIITPRLSLKSPTKRCGKTTALAVLGRLVCRPLPAANISPAAIYRTIDLARPTMLVDEADTFLQSDEIGGILNSGHFKPQSFVTRTVGDDHEPRQFSTWAPMAIAGIGARADTLEDRSIIVEMRRKRPDEQVDRLRLDRLDHLDEFASKIARWADDHKGALRQADPIVPQSLHDRAADNWRPLLAIADAAGGSWPDRAREAAAALGQGNVDEQIGIMVLEDIRAIFNDSEHNRLLSEEVIERLHQIEDRPWPEYGRQRKPISKNQLSRLLRPFDINSASVRRGERTGKGYKIEQFQDAFARYLSHGQNSVHTPDSRIQNVTSSQARATAAFGQNQSVTIDPNVTFQNRRNPAVDNGCDDVTFRNPENGLCAQTAHEIDGDQEEREAIQAIEGEAALCVHCREFVGLNESSVPCDGRVLHERCHDAFFGFERQDHSEQP